MRLHKWHGRGAGEIAIVVLVASLLVLAYFSLTWRTGDEARYFVLARSLSSGQGYTQIHHPFTPPETLTPPLYPVLASLSMRLAGAGDSAQVRAAKAVSCVMYLLAAAVCPILLRRLGLSWYERIAGVALGLAVVGLLTMTCWCMAETTYIFFSLAALAVLYRQTEYTARSALIGGILCGLAYLSRAVGLSLLAGAGIYFLLSRRWKPLFWFAVGFCLAAGWWTARSTALTGLPEPYLSYTAGRVGATSVSDYPVRLLLNQWRVGLPSYLFGLLSQQMFYNLTWGRNLLGMLGLGALARPVEIATALLVTGGWALRLRRPGPMEFYWPIYWLMVAGQPIPPEQTYYVFPAMVPAAVYWITAVITLGNWLGRRGLAVSRFLVVWAGIYALATACTAGIVHLVKEAPRRHLAPWAPERYLSYSNAYMNAWARYVEACQWVGSNSPPESLIVCRKPQHAYVFSGCKAWRYDVPEEVGCPTPWDAVRRLGRKQNVYIIEDAFHVRGDDLTYAQNYRSAMIPLLASLSNSLSCVYTSATPAAHVWRYRVNVR